VAEGEDAAHAGGRDHRIHRTGRGQKIFRRPCLGRIRRRRVDVIGHVGGGFTTNHLKGIREKLDPLIQKECPFTVRPETNAPVTWVKPEMVCEVALSGWSEDGVMRHPVFQRLREDKTAREVVREKPLESRDGGP